MDETTFSCVPGAIEEIGCTFVATLTRRIQESAVFVRKPVVQMLLVPQRRRRVKPVPVDSARMCVGPFHWSPCAIHVRVTVKPSRALP